MTVFVRFAPSPTGYLHIGNLRPALFNWLFAQRHGGRFLLRYDDTDRDRSKAGYAEAIAEDLAWIGIRPDAVARQSDRISHYDAAADLLRDSGVLYPCYETADELERMRKRRMGRGQPPVYGREAMRLSAEDRARLEADGARPHWRFRLPNFVDDPLQPVRTEVHWDDVVRGRQTVDLASLSDPVLIREDGTYLYTFCSVVDDGEMGITHVLRGDDHVTNTGVQIAILEALGHAIPAFGHFNLLTTIDGEGLSKRTGALSLRSLREDGLEPMAVASLAVLTGLSGSIEAMPDLKALEARLDFDHVSASSSKFDPAELERLNAELVHAMPYEVAADRLRALGVSDDAAEAFWAAVRRNCGRVRDAPTWRDIVFGRSVEAPTWSEDDLAFVRQAFDLLPDGPWDSGTWRMWTERVKAATGRKGRALFMPLRLALTGLEHGPELADLLPLIGAERAVSRRP
ncbi:glutamate--tRNA ligase [Aureimonas sp. Leaf324]|jgi:glutamyl-tRNA synthetase|uniref:glutamate--tRNA ligase n=1 Tax=Aureimonas sp. Leaf324 TaxID=1736336 RepID=UPI0006F9DFF2|nr:glutamate--tRNA ligase [Aureimonas sp. Leaf324]KQQ91329.1 glutamine--tRNA ligase [Aureimonas sp. Leaf324]